MTRPECQEKRRQRGVSEASSLLEIREVRPLFLHEERQLRKVLALIQEMDALIQQSRRQAPGSAPDVPPEQA